MFFPGSNIKCLSICDLYTDSNSYIYRLSHEERSVFLGGNSMSYSKQNNVYVRVLFQTVPEIELSHCTVVWIWCPILSFPPAC
jgi:hypothetical protein